MVKNLRQHENLPPIFVDRCLGSSLVVKAIREAGYVAIAHDDEFPADAADPEWLQAVGAKGWIVLTHDKNITKNVAELQAMIQANVHVFFVDMPNPSGKRLVDAVIAALPDIEEIVCRMSPPSAALINTKGKVGRLEGYEKLLDRIQDIRRRQHLE